MVVGVGTIALMVHSSSSLKAKRKVVKSILGRTRSKFDVSIAEVGYQDKWQRAQLGFAVVSNEAGHAHRLCETVLGYVESLHLAEIIDCNVEIVHYGLGDHVEAKFGILSDSEESNSCLDSEKTEWRT